jgi:Flp pilus assembly protein TadG
MVRRRKGRRSLRMTRQLGTAAVEFALTLPLVLVLALVVLQFGLLAKDQLVLMGAARAGVREAAVTTQDQEVRAAVIGSAPSLDTDRLHIAVAREGGAGAPVTVSLQYAHRAALPGVRWFLPDTVTLRSASTMRQETE